MSKTTLWVPAAVMLLAGSLLAMQDAPAALVVTGTLQIGVVAVGGETTGVTVTTLDGKTTYELDIKDPVLKQKANQFAGKLVTISGTLTLKQGIEVPQRKIIAVESLVPADMPPPTMPTTSR